MDGSKLREIRKASGKTLRQISFESNVTESQIIQIETGQTQNPRIDTLLGLAKALNCEISDFLS